LDPVKPRARRGSPDPADALTEGLRGAPGDPRTARSPTQTALPFEAAFKRLANLFGWQASGLPVKQRNLAKSG
jgi:hypothetical protein